MRKIKNRLGFKLQIVESPGVLWKNKSVEEIVAMLSAKTKLLGKLVVRLLKDNREIGHLVIELLSIMGGDASAEALSMAHARNESPVVDHDPAAPNLSNWQMKVQAHVNASENMAQALIVGLESLADLIVAKQASETERIALARVENSNVETTENIVEKAMMVDASTTTEAGGVTGGVDQNGDITLQPASIEDENNVPLDLSVSMPVDMSMSSMREAYVGLTEQASFPPTFTPATSTKPNVLVEQMESVEIFIETDEIILLSPEEVRERA